jgi:hypothetical protein
MMEKLDLSMNELQYCRGGHVGDGGGNGRAISWEGSELVTARHLHLLDAPGGGGAARICMMEVGLDYR